jgi:hypothetical protein
MRRADRRKSAVFRRAMNAAAAAARDTLTAEP